MAIYITSDTHFGHDKDFIYVPRGFQNVYEMNEAIISNWNKVVNMEDDVYLLGDVIMGVGDSNIGYLKQLKGKIHIICGNHDTDKKIEFYKKAYNVVEVCYATRLKYKKCSFFLSHYPTLCANVDDDKKIWERTYNLCGHSHTSDKWSDWDKGMIYHVDPEAHGCTPVEIETIIEDIRNKIAGHC